MTFAKIVAFLAHLSRGDGPYTAPASLNLYRKSSHYTSHHITYMYIHNMSE